TVYRTLALLSEKGVVDVLSHHGGEQCYRLCGDEHHHHLLCERCHRVVEVQECGLDDWVTAAAKRHGFVATDHRVEIVGLCADCRKRQLGGRFSRKARSPSWPSSLVRRSATQRAVSGPSGRSRTSRLAQRAACGPAERSSPTTRSTAPSRSAATSWTRPIRSAGAASTRSPVTK